MKGKRMNKKPKSRQGKDKPYKRDDQQEQSRFGRRDDTSKTEQRHGLNDFGWYNKYPELLFDTARLPFPNRPGMSFDPFGSLTNVTDSTYEIPGTLGLSWAPTCGWSRSVLDPASLAAKEIYAKVRSAFSGSLDADAPDFLIYILALDSIFSYIGSLKRLYRILDAYNPNNYAIPQTLLQAYGLSEDEATTLRSDKANFKYAINELIRMSRKFIMPDVMDIFRRHYWMNDNVYADAASPLAQTYMFVQRGYFKFAMLQAEGQSEGILAGGLTMVQDPITNGTNTTVEALYDFGVSLISALAESDDAYTISGYLMRAFQGANQFIVEELVEKQELTMEYEPEVLAQIENSRGLTLNNEVPWNISMLKNTNVTQNPSNNTIVHAPTYNLPSQYVDQAMFANHEVLSMRSDMPSAEDVVVGSRLHPAYIKVPQTSGAPIVEIHGGTEIPMGWVYYKFDIGKNQVVTQPLSPYGYLYLAINTSSTVTINFNQILAIGEISAFDWHPIGFTIIDRVSTTVGPLGANSQVVPVGDIHNVATVEQNQLAKIHRVCILSEFNAFSVV